MVRKVLGSLRARGEIEETPFGPNAERPGMRMFEARAWPASGAVLVQ